MERAEDNDGKLPWTGSSLQRGDICDALQCLHPRRSHTIVCSFIKKSNASKKDDMMTIVNREIQMMESDHTVEGQGLTLSLPGAN